MAGHTDVTTNEIRNMVQEFDENGDGKLDKKGNLSFMLL